MTEDPSQPAGSPRGEPPETVRSPATLVIAGMHRSGTSLIASAFQLAGVDVGAHLDGPSRGNPRGHFEDIDFQKFHEGVLERVGKNFLTVTQADLAEMTPDDVEHAKALIDRRQARLLWGWKDPRTSLFLDFWHPLLVNPRYVFVYRHPLEVVLSLFRRGWYVEEVENPLTALEAWRRHNQAILDFYRRHRDRCVLGHVRAMAADLVGTVSACARRFGLDLMSESASAVYQPSELDQSVIPGDVLDEFARIAPAVAVLYRRLEQAADLPEAGAARPAEPSALASAVPDGRRDADALRRDFELLLAQVEPRAFLTGKHALDELRRRELESIGARCLHLASEVAAHQARLADLEAENGALRARLAELVAQNTGLQSEVVVVERVRAGVETRLVRLDADVTELRQSLEEPRRSLAELKEQAATDRAERATIIQRGAESAARAEARLDADMAELRRSLEESQRSLAELKEQAATDRAERAAIIQRQAESAVRAETLAQAEARLAAIERSRAWRAVQTWHALKRAAARILSFSRASS